VTGLILVTARFALMTLAKEEKLGMKSETWLDMISDAVLGRRVYLKSVNLARDVRW